MFNDLKIGSPLLLVREDENAYDHDAVAIFYGDTHIGYVPSSKNEQLVHRHSVSHLRRREALKYVAVSLHRLGNFIG